MDRIKIHILIPATPRYELHKECCIDIVKKLNVHYDVCVYINFDIPKVLSNKFNEIEQTIDELNKYSSVVSFINDESPCFSKAFFKCFSMLNEYADDDDDVIFWLEDDWSLVADKPFFGSIEELKNYDTICCVNPTPSGPPFLFNKKFLAALIKYVKYFDERSSFYGIDPEKIIQHTYDLNKNIIKNKRTGNRTDCPSVFNNKSLPIVFKDRGREWRSQNKLTKWKNKGDKHLKTWT